ncbi:MAG TPA: GNAT family N-acetyltransferase [Dongiaceae bacterium]|jgi:GNAT superfamily N-acetyltransferase
MAPALRIVIRDDEGLTAADRQALAALSGAVHPPGSPPNPVTAGLEWADATLRAMGWQEGRMVCHVGALLRAAIMDGHALRVGGVGEVMTAPDARRRGHAKAALKAMCRHLIEVRQASFLMLFCAPALHGFYGRLGWRPFTGKLLIGQHGDSIAFPLDPPLAQDGREAMPATGVLDLRGPPW